jgi:DMSO/TMAO reductase YedYZ molybdopterin-dependent catalytic subunit
VLGAHVPFGGSFPRGLIPAALADTAEPFRITGKVGEMVVLNDRPLTAETPAHLLDDDVTPADRMFVRNHGVPPRGVDASRWTLTIDGEAVPEPKTFSIEQLKSEFKAHTYRLVLECAGNGRKEFHPTTRGPQWTTGADSCGEWTGVRLKDVLKAAGVSKDAVYVGYAGRDVHLTGDMKRAPISRGVPMAKAMQPETLLAWSLNGKDIPLVHGAPLRLVVGGWPASASGKWLWQLLVRDRVHDGAQMGGGAYRVPCKPGGAGQSVGAAEQCIIESMPVKSLITSPRSGITHPLAQPLAVRGHAWAGERRVKQLAVSVDFGQTWQRARLEKPANRLAWQRFRADVRFPTDGYYEVWSRAVDDAGRAQPMVVPGWNPGGYLNNACHRLAVRVTA